LPRWTFGDGGAAGSAGPFPGRRKSHMPDRGSEDGKRITGRSILADSPETVSARGLYRGATVCGAGGIDSPPPIGSRFHKCPIGGGTSGFAVEGIAARARAADRNSSRVARSKCATRSGRPFEKRRAARGRLLDEP